MNDGSEQVELEQVQVSEIAMLRAQLKIAQGLNEGIGNQLRDSFALLRESREMLARFSNLSIAAFDVIDSDKLIDKIDTFYPQPEIES